MSTNPVQYHPSRYMGAFHGAEVPFVFGDGFELSSDGEVAAAVLTVADI